MLFRSLTPVEIGQGHPSLAPAPGVRVITLGISEPRSRSALTDTQGDYRINLPPGTYRVTIEPLTGMEFTKNVPVTVSVSAGHETHLDIHIDTGIR